MADSARDPKGIRTDFLRRLRACGVGGGTPVDFAGFYAHRRVKDGRTQRHVANAARALNEHVRQGNALRLTGPGRHARYCITAQGISWLRELENAARAAAGGAAQLEESSAAWGAPGEAAPISENSFVDDPPAGLFD